MIKNIIFDLGVVLLNVDYSKTIIAFEKLGLKDAERAFSKQHQGELFKVYERGNLSDDRFLEELSRRTLCSNISLLKEAWCAMLGELPKHKLEFLHKLKQEYRLFILSNTNRIHQRWFEEKIEQTYGWENFSSCFEFVGYSHLIGERKPDLAAFDYIPRKFDLRKKETLFIDDTMEHVEGAQKAGIMALHYEKDQDLSSLLHPHLTK